MTKQPGSVLDPPNLNTGTPWSEEDIADLEWGIKHRTTVDRIADFLCRTEIEIREKAGERGFLVSGRGGRGVRQTRDDWYDVYYFARKHRVPAGQARDLIERYGSDRERAINEAQMLKISNYATLALSRPG